MTYSIIESYEQSQNNWITRIQLDSSTSLFMNSKTRPTQEEVDTQAKASLDMKADKLAQINIEKEEEKEKNVTPD
tara:strand:- start:382 stop:606 length:225 start_codon:yes stop_codon:yes gene_type:complete